MKIYFGKDSVWHSNKSIDKSAILYKDENIILSSDKCPLVELQLGKGRVLFVWGHLYAIHQPDGTTSKLDLSKDENSILKEVATRSNLKEFIKNLEGHFVGVLINSENDICVFADIYNRKDVFYTLRDNNLVASTDLKAVVDSCPLIKYDQAALVSMFNLYGNYVPKKHTIYKGIYRLGISERIEFSQGEVEIKSSPFEPVSIQDYDKDKLHEYSKLMHSAVEVRGSDECNWVYLSSGWDSSSIIALLTKIYGSSKVHAVIGRCKYSSSTGVNNQVEVDRAKKIAEYFSVPLDILDIDYTKQDYVRFLKEIRESLKANHLYSLLNYNYLKLAEHVSKNGDPSHPVFNGEISDGAHNLGFAQFTTILDHPDINFREYSDKMASYLFGPSFFSRILSGKSNNDFIYNTLRSRMSDCIFDDPSKMDEKQRKTKFVESFFLFSKRVPFISLSNSKLLTKKGTEEYESIMCETYFKDFTEKVTPETLYSWILHLYNSFHWQGGTVKGITHASEHYDIDASMPFWDSRIQSFLSAMPESWGRGLDLNPTKYPLKWMLKNEVDYPNHLQVGPHSYLYDVDPSWNGIADILYGSAGKPYFKELIKDYQFEEILKESHFNLDYLRKLTDGYINDKEVSGQELTDLMNLVSLCLVGWY